MNEINYIHDQLKRMRAMNKFYHHQFLVDVRLFFGLSMILLFLSFNQVKVSYLLPFIALFGSVILAFHAYYLIFSRHYSEFLEKKINKLSKSQIFITHELENSYFFPLNDKKIVVAKLGKNFTWFSFVTLFITFYGICVYTYGMFNIYTVLKNLNIFYFIILITLVTFFVGYWWFINNIGEKRMELIYDI